MTVVPMGPAKLDLSGVRAGDRNQVTITISSGGVPMDLTGKTVTSQARVTAAAEEAMDAVVEVTDALAGVLTLRWPGEDVATMLAGKATVKGVWDLQVASSGSDPVTLVAGSITCELDVTRP